MRPVLIPASKLVLDLPTPEEWKAELTYRLPGSAPAGNGPPPGTELAISRVQVQRPNHYTTQPPTTILHHVNNILTLSTTLSVLRA